MRDTRQRRRRQSRFAVAMIVVLAICIVAVAIVAITSPTTLQGDIGTAIFTVGVLAALGFAIERTHGLIGSPIMAHALQVQGLGMGHATSMTGVALFAWTSETNTGADATMHEAVAVTDQTWLSGGGDGGGEGARRHICK